MKAQALLLCVAGVAALQTQRGAFGRRAVAARFAPPAAPAAAPAVAAPEVPAPDGAEAFGKLASEAGPVAEMLAELPPTLGNAASKGVVLLGAAASFVAMPGSLIFSIAGAAVGGSLLRFTVAPQLVEGRYKSMQAKVAMLLRDAAEAGDWESTSPEAVASIVSSWGLPAQYAKSALAQIYARFLLELMTTGDASTGEIKELQVLQSILGLDEDSCGDAFSDVGMEVYNSVQWALDGEDTDWSTPEAKRISKLLFLCDRVFGDESFDETRSYMVGRVRKVLYLSDATAKRRVSVVAQPFYERALVGTVAKLDKIDSAMLTKTRAKLGIEEEVWRTMHDECYAEQVQQKVYATSPEVIDDDSKAFLDKLASVLEMDLEKAQKVFEAETLPMFTSYAKDACASAFDDESVAGVAEAISQRRTELQLAAGAADGVVAEQCRARLDEVYEAAAAAVKSKNAGEALFFAGDLARTFGLAKNLMEATLVAGDAAFIQKTLTGHPQANGLSKKLYQAYLDDTVGKGSVSDDQRQELAVLRGMLDISQGAADRMHAASARSALRQFLSGPVQTGKYDADALRAFLTGIDYPAELFSEEAETIWAGQLRQFNDENPLLSDARTAQLAALRVYLGLDEAQVLPFVDEVCVPVYKKSVLEAMAASGASLIMDDYVAGLEKLRLRLGLTADQASKAFESATAARVAMLVKHIDDSLTQAQSSSYELALPRGLDTFMNDCCTLADFLTMNPSLASEELDGTWSYAVVAKIAPKQAEKIFSEYVRRFLASAQTNPDSRVARFYKALPHVGAGLGLDADHYGGVRDAVAERFFGQLRKNPQAEMAALQEKFDAFP
ncbi:hypothetical protein M885DRAFT_619025 [Pelagophyceae sp. CCMP2097]|nr:hypothetical protein M885DRAFT_619025 [Pelagophyceae sp. CCMP2097]